MNDQALEEFAKQLRKDVIGIASLVLPNDSAREAADDVIVKILKPIFLFHTIQTYILPLVYTKSSKPAVHLFIQNRTIRAFV